MAKDYVVIFEDNLKTREKLNVSFNNEFSKLANIHIFRGSGTDMSQSELPYDKRIILDLKSQLGEASYNMISLIVTDKVLTKIDSYHGLSDITIADVADSLATPICYYTREITDEERRLLMQLREWQDFKILIDYEHPDKIASKCKIIYDGFKTIKSSCKKILDKNPNIKSPAELLARILGRPYLQDKIALYAAGDTHMLTEIIPYRDKPEEIREKRMPRLLGYWLWNSIMKFPGILLNEVACASYLNIDVDSFRKKDLVRHLFEKALYTGPFAEYESLWWRDDLDDILANAKCIDGLQLTKEHKIPKIKPCMCEEDKSLRAGYYCVITKRAVSNEKSHANISWFPAGADLTRVSNSIYEELGPWAIGLF